MFFRGYPLSNVGVGTGLSFVQRIYITNVRTSAEEREGWVINAVK